MLASYVRDNQSTWDKLLQKVAYAIQTTKHDFTGHSPYFVNYGRSACMNSRDHLAIYVLDDATREEAANENESPAFREIFADV